MRIVVDLTPLAVPPSGIGYYLREATAAMAVVAPDDEICALALTGRNEAIGLGEQLAHLPPTIERRHRRIIGAAVWRRLANVAPLPLLEPLAGRCDAFIGSEWLYPRQRHGLRVAIVYDLVPLHLPETATPATRRMHLAKHRDVARADVVVCISSGTARDVVERLGVDPDRVRVARPGVGERFRTAVPASPGPAAGRPYLLGLSTLEPRKNFGGLIEAFALVRQRHPGLALVLVGAAGWGDDEVEARTATLGLGDAIVRTGYLPEAEVAGVVAGARVVCSTSLFEGFGIPIAEALAAGVPVVCSDGADVDDACGPAGLRVPVREPDAVAAAIERLLVDDDLRAAQVALGKAHVADLTWEACASAILAAIREWRLDASGRRAR